MSNIVNGYPNDPIELRPFDYWFRPRFIPQWWIAVSFLPMTRNALNDQKAGYQLGDGGAPKEESKRLELLAYDNRKCAASLDNLGFDSELLDIELPKVEQRELQENKQAAVAAIVNNEGSICKAGSLFKIGQGLANGRVILEAHAQIEKKKREKQKKKDGEKESKDEAKAWTAVGRYNQWKNEGKPTDGERPKFKKPGFATDILKVLLPRIDPTDKISKYNSGKKSIN